MRYHKIRTYRRASAHAPSAHGKTATAESFSGTVPIYAAPSDRAAVVGSAPCGAQFVVLGRQAGWHAVRYDQCQGYVPNAKIVLNY